MRNLAAILHKVPFVTCQMKEVGGGVFTETWRVVFFFLDKKKYMVYVAELPKAEPAKTGSGFMFQF